MERLMICSLRNATAEDTQVVFQWRNNPWIIALSSTQSQVAWEEHVAWFNNILISSQHLVFIIELEAGVNVGVVRLDLIEDNSQALITVYLMPEFTGKGIGVSAIVNACFNAFFEWDIHSIHAYIRNANYPSLSAFRKVGFKCVEPSIRCPNDHSEMIVSRVDFLVRDKN
jgi:RimJ/RimL family protein N-acetyltransferase